MRCVHTAFFGRCCQREATTPLAFSLKLAWCVPAFNNLELNTLKTVEMIMDIRRNPPALPPLTIMDSTVATVETFRFLGTTISQNLSPSAQQMLYFLRQLRKFNLTQELLKCCHHWIRPLYFYNCLVQLSYQIWPQKTTEGSTDCWANRWYNPPHSPRTVLIQSELKGWQNPSGPLTSSTLPLWTVAIWSTLQTEL